MGEAEKDKFKFNRVRRYLFWPAVVLGALNIETVAQLYGGDRILTWAVQKGGPMIGWLANAQRWPEESGQSVKWTACLNAARVAADQETK